MNIFALGVSFVSGTASFLRADPLSGLFICLAGVIFAIHICRGSAT